MSVDAFLHCSADRIEVSGKIDFDSVIALQREGDLWLRETAPEICVLDMGGVTRCNSAGTALLLAWLRTAAEVGKSLRLVHPPESLNALMQLAGLEKVLKNVTLVPAQ